MTPEQPTIQQRPELLSQNVRGKIRLYDCDDKRIITLKKKIGTVSNLSIIDIIRICVHEGLPHLEKHWDSILKPAETITAEKPKPTDNNQQQ